MLRKIEKRLRKWFLRRASQHRRSAYRSPLALERLEDRTLLSPLPLTLADPSLNGITGLKDSSHPSISADGRFIAFQSNSDNLVPNDTDGLSDVFVFNRGTGIVTLVSVGPNGMAGGGDNPVISADGRYVAFESNTRGILPSFTNDGRTQIFLRDLQTGTTTLLSGLGGAGGNHDSSQAAFSADSQHVGFLSNANNLVTGVTFHNSTGSGNLFEDNLTAGTISLVSVSPDSTADGNAPTDGFSLSADGRFVAFQSLATNLVSLPDNNIHHDIFVRDMLGGTTTLVSANAGDTGTALNGDSTGPSISADGLHVDFISNGQDLINGVSGQNVYLRDLVNGTTTLLNAGPSGAPVGSASGAVMSPDGRYIAFMTGGALLTADTNGNNDVYVYDTQAQTLSLASVNVAGTNGGNGDSGFTGGQFGNNGGLAFSADGRSLVFRSVATDLTAGVITSQGNLYLRNLAAGTTTLLTPNQTATDGGNGDAAGMPVLSADGRYVAFATTDSNLIAGDTNGAPDVYVRDIQASHPVLAAPRSPLLPSYNFAQLGGILGDASADGRYVVFASNVENNKSDLAPNVTFNPAGGSYGIYVRDTQTGALQVVDLLSNGQEAGAIITNPQDQMPIITPDGRYVVFRSESTALVPGITYTQHATNIFIRDLQTQTTRLVSVDPTGTHDVPVPGDTQIAVSADGRYVAFTTNVQAPYAGVSNGKLVQHYILLHDFGDGTSTPTTVLVSGGTANDGVIHGDSRDISMTPDGHYVLFRSQDGTLTSVPKGNNGYDVYRWDRTTGRIDLVSINDTGTASGDSESSPGYPPSMTADGRFVTFASSAYDLVPGMDTAIQSPRYSIVYERDMGDGTTPANTTVIALGPDPSDNENATVPSISASGAVVYLKPVTVQLPPPPNPNPKKVVAVFLGGKMIAAGFDDSGGFIHTTDQGTLGPIVSPDGRYVAFWSRASNIIPDFVDGNGNNGDLYLADAQTGETKLISWDESGTASAAGENLDHVSFTGNSQYLLFDSYSGNLIPGDNSNASERNVYMVPTAGFSSIGGNVFADLNRSGVSTGNPGLQYWTVFLDANGNGVLDPGEDQVVTDAQGNYVFRNLVPGTYTVTIVPQAGYHQTVPTGPNTYTVTITADGTAVTGQDFGEVVALPDLETTNVSFSPASAAPGQMLTVSWTMTNQGTTGASGGWQDTAYLSTTPALTDSSVVLGSAAGSAVGPGGSYNASWTGELPAVLPGPYYVVVQADSIFQLPDPKPDNNILATVQTLDVTLPSLTTGTPYMDSFAAAGQDRYYQVTASQDGALTLTLASAAADGQTGLFLSDGYLPTPYAYEYAAALPQPGQSLTVSVLDSVTYYVLAHSVAGAAATSSFQLTAQYPTVTLQGVSPNAGGNSGKVTIAFHGLDLVAGMTASLVLGSTTLDAVSTLLSDPTTLLATFDLTAAPTGVYDARITDPVSSATATLASAFTVHSGIGGHLSVSLSMPSAMRPARQAAVDIIYSNTGDEDITLPMLTLVDPQGGLFQYLADGVGDTGQMTFLAPPVLPGLAELPPGAKGSVQLYCTPAVTQGSVELTVYGDTFDDPAFADQPIDWAAASQALRPSGVSDQAWAAYVSASQARYGNTYGDLFNFLTTQIQTFTDPDVEQEIFVDGQWIFRFRPQDPLAQTSIRDVFYTPVPGLSAVPPPTSVNLMPGPPSDQVGMIYPLIVADDFSDRSLDGNLGPALSGVDKDASALNQLFKGGYNLPDSQVKTLQSGPTTPLTPDQVTNAIKNEIQGRNSNDVVIIFLDAHGTAGSSQTTPANVPGLVLDGGNLVTADMLNQALAGAPCPVYLIDDSCHSQALTTGITDQNVIPVNACLSNQTAVDQGSFTQAIINALQANPNGNLQDILNQAASAFQASHPNQNPQIPNVTGGQPKMPNIDFKKPIQRAEPPGPRLAHGATPIVKPRDPNELIGPAGIGTQNFVSASGPLAYTIECENQPSASAAAQQVVITTQLDSNLDLSTFALGDISFGSVHVQVPFGVQSYQVDVAGANPDGSPLIVEISASLDRDTRQVTWTFASIDPATGSIPQGAFDGFLPPDNAGGSGECRVTYTIQPNADVMTSAVLDAQASIVFDTNPHLDTNTAANTIDAVAPTSRVNPLPVNSLPNFTVSWTGQDDANGSGIAVFDVYVSDNGGPFQLWQNQTTATSAVYSGQLGHNYAFFSVAVDHVGNMEVKAPVIEAQTNTAVLQATPSEPAGSTSPLDVKIAALLAGHYSDPDPKQKAGIAVTELSGSGTWQYASGKSWINITSVSETNALLLPATDQLRFMPAGLATGQAELLYVGWDGSQGKPGGRGNAAIGGGGAAFSASAGSLDITLTAVTRAPVWVAASTTLTPVSPGATNPPGQTVAQAFAGVFSGDNNQAAGVAIVGSTASAKQGAWQYALYDSDTQMLGAFTNLPKVSAKAALLLGPQDMIRFVPAGTFTGAVSLQVRAWDQTSGSDGGTVNLSKRAGSGGTTAFSSTVLTAKLHVNHAPTQNPPAGGIVLGSSAENVAGPAIAVATLIKDAHAADLDKRTKLGIAIIGWTGQGTGQYKLQGGTWQALPQTLSPTAALLLPPSAQVRFQPAPDESGTVSIPWQAWDQTQGAAGMLYDITASGDPFAFSTATATATLTITPASQVPIWSGSSAALTPVLPGTYSLTGSQPAGDSVAAIFGAFFVDGTNTNPAVAVTALTGTANGTWQYSRDGGTTWTSFGTVSTKQVRLLTASDRIRFVPRAGFLGKATLSAYAWDGTAGSDGGTAKVHGSAFSKTTLTATCLVNTAPVLA